MARAFGSYPKCHRFESSRRYHGPVGQSPWRVGQAAKTPPFHGGNTGSIPVRVTTDGRNRSRSYGGLAQLVRAPASHAGGHWFESSSLHQENSLEPQGFKEFFCFLVAFSLVFSLTMVFPYPAETPRIKHSVRCALSRFICSVRLILPFSQGFLRCVHIIAHAAVLLAAEAEILPLSCIVDALENR